MMKIKALTDLMNDHGTNPRIRVMMHMQGATILFYEGSIKTMDEETQRLKVNTFTVLGKGFIEIHTS